MNIVRLLFRIALIFISGLSLSSCSDEETVDIKAINLSPDVGPIDVFVDGGPLFTSIGYLEASQNGSLSVETHDLKVTLHESFTTLDDSSYSLRDERGYTLFVFDFGENADVVLDSNTSSGSESDRSKLRFVQGSPTADSVDVYITGPTDPLTNAIPTFDNLNFKKITGYVDSEEGDYRIRVTEKDSFNVLVDTGTIATNAGDIFTILLSDKVGGGAPFQISLINDRA